MGGGLIWRLVDGRFGVKLGIVSMQEGVEREVFVLFSKSREPFMRSQGLGRPLAWKHTWSKVELKDWINVQFRPRFMGITEEFGTLFSPFLEMVGELAPSKSKRSMTFHIWHGNKRDIYGKRWASGSPGTGLCEMAQFVLMAYSKLGIQLSCRSREEELFQLTIICIFAFICCHKIWLCIIPTTPEDVIPVLVSGPPTDLPGIPFETQIWMRVSQCRGWNAISSIFCLFVANRVRLRTMTCTGLEYTGVAFHFQGISIQKSFLLNPIWLALPCTVSPGSWKDDSCHQWRRYIGDCGYIEACTLDWYVSLQTRWLRPEHHEWTSTDPQSEPNGSVELEYAWGTRKCWHRHGPQSGASWRQLRYSSPCGLLPH